MFINFNDSFKICITVKPALDGSKWTMGTRTSLPGLLTMFTLVRNAQKCVMAEETASKGNVTATQATSVSAFCPFPVNICSSDHFPSAFLEPFCQPNPAKLLTFPRDDFERGISALYWEDVTGANLAMGCGSLLPKAHGRNLYFNGCGAREATTHEMNITKARQANLLSILQNLEVTVTPSFQ